jgi:hypothetical protein
MAKTALIGALLLVLPPGAFVSAQQPKAPSAADINDLAAKYRAERDHVVSAGVARRFPPALFAKADEIAKRGEAALQSGRLLQASEAFRQARWQLPYQSLQVPDHVSRILGNMRLRHGNEIRGVAFSADGSKLATASRDHTVKIWDLGNGHEILT